MGRRLNAVQFFGPESERARSVFQTDPHSELYTHRAALVALGD